MASVLPSISERLIAAGARLLVVSGNAAQRAELDTALWAYRPDSFLPHGCAGGAYDAAQPLLITDRLDPLNAARNVALVDGNWDDQALSFDRAFLFFADDMIDGARGAWRGLASREGVERHYWKQDEGGKWREGP